MKRFYVGAKHIGAAIKNGTDAGCTRHTVEEAIDEAKRMIREEHLDCVVVVQIIRIVRKEYPPITVEEV